MITEGHQIDFDHRKSRFILRCTLILDPALTAERVRIKLPAKDLAQAVKFRNGILALMEAAEVPARVRMRAPRINPSPKHEH